MLLYAKQQIIFQNSNICITTKDMNQINDLLSMNTVEDNFNLNMSNFDINNQSNALNAVLIKIPGEQHDSIYKSLLEYLDKLYINVSNISKNVIELIFLPSFILKYYGAQIIGSSPFKQYYYNKSQQNITYILKNIKDNTLINAINLHRYNKDQIITTNGKEYRIIEMINTSLQQDVHIVYTCMIKDKNINEYTLSNIKYNLEGKSAEYIVHDLKMHYQSKITGLRRETILETDKSNQAKNDLYCLNNKYSYFIYLQYSDDEFRILIPVLKYYKSITYFIDINFNQLSILY